MQARINARHEHALRYTRNASSVGDVLAPSSSRKSIRTKNGAANWPDVLRSAATMVAGAIAPSQLLRKFASYPRQHELAAALREIGRGERTLFIIDWVLDPEMRRRALIGLNKGEIRDHSSEGQHYRMVGLNLLAAIVIY